MRKLSEQAPGAENPTRAQRRAFRTRARLMAAALAKFAEHGVDLTTIEDITEAADLGKGTFYRYFASKEDVVLALLHETVERLLEHTGERVRDATGLPQLLERLLEAHTSFFAERRAEFLLLFQGRLLLTLDREDSEGLEDPILAYLAGLEAMFAPFLPASAGRARIRRLACALAGLVTGFLSFAMVTMAPEEITRSLGPLRQAFVEGSSLLLRDA
jgi:AcrR family transcriptional regulator